MPGAALFTKTAKPIQVSPSLVQMLMDSALIGTLKASASHPDWDTLVQTDRARWWWDIAPYFEKDYPGVLASAGFTGKFHLSLWVSPQPAPTPQTPVISAKVDVSHGALIIEIGKLSAPQATHPTPFLIKEIQQTLEHELAHLLQMGYQGGDAYRAQIKNIDPKRNGEAFLSHNYETKAISAELVSPFKAWCANHPEITEGHQAIQGFLEADWQWPVLKSRMDTAGQQTIMRDLAWVWEKLQAIPVTAAAAKPRPDLEAMVQEFMGVLDPEGVMPRPPVRVVKQSGKDWGGITRTSWTVERGTGLITEVTSTIDIQSYMADVPTSARRIMAHECCHAAQFQSSYIGLTAQEQEVNRKINDADGHGKFFQEAMAKINAVYGPDFVTKTSDETYEKAERPQVYYFLLQKPDGVIVLSSAGKPSFSQVNFIKSKKAIDPSAVKLVRCPELDWARGALAIGKGWNRPVAPDAIADVQGLWDSSPDLSQDFMDKEVKFPPFWILMECPTFEVHDPMRVSFSVTKALTPQLKKRLKDMARWQETKVMKMTSEDLWSALPVLGKQRPVQGRNAVLALVGNSLGATVEMLWRDGLTLSSVV